MHPTPATATAQPAKAQRYDLVTLKNALRTNRGWLKMPVQALARSQDLFSGLAQLRFYGYIHTLTVSREALNGKPQEHTEPLSIRDVAYLVDVSEKTAELLTKDLADRGLCKR